MSNWHPIDTANPHGFLWHVLASWDGRIRLAFLVVLAIMLVAEIMLLIDIKSLLREQKKRKNEKRDS